MATIIHVFPSGIKRTVWTGKTKEDGTKWLLNNEQADGEYYFLDDLQEVLYGIKEDRSFKEDKSSRKGRKHPAETSSRNGSIHEESWQADKRRWL